MLNQSESRRYDRAAGMSLFGYSSSLVIFPISLVHLSRIFSLSLSQGGFLLALAGATIFTMLLVSCYAIRRWGILTSMRIGVLFHTLGLFLLVRANSFYSLLFGLFVMSIGNGLIEALVTPLIEKSHPKHFEGSDTSEKHQKGTKSISGYINRAHSFYSLGIVVMAVSSGEFLQAGGNWRFLFLIVSLFPIISFFLLKSPHDGDRFKLGENPLHGAKRLYKKKAFWFFSILLFLGGLLESVYTFWSSSYIQLEFDHASPEIAIRIGAWATMLFALGMFLTRLSMTFLCRRFSLYQLTSASSFLGIIASLILAKTEGLIMFFTMLFVAGIAIACYWPTFQTWCTEVLHDEESSLIFILMSCFGMAGVSCASWLVGLIGDSYSINASLVMIPFIFSLLIVLGFFAKKFEK